MFLRKRLNNNIIQPKLNKKRERAVILLEALTTASAEKYILLEQAYFRIFKIESQE